VRRFCALLGLAALLTGCSSLPSLPEIPVGKPSTDGEARYGSYCEQLGHLKASPAWESCVRKQENLYK